MVACEDRRVWLDTDRPGEQIAVGSPMPHVQLMCARQSNRLWREYHADMKVCLIDPGQDGVVAHFSCRGRSHSTPSSGIMLFEPGDNHVTTQVPIKADFSVVSLVPDDVRAAAQDLGIRGEFHFRTVTLSDPGVATSVHRFVRGVAHGVDTLHLECLYAEMVRVIVETCGDKPRVGRLDPVRHYGVRLVRDILRENFAENHTLDDLAAKAGLSKFWLARAFKSWVGMPPHSYLHLRRACEARRLIEGDVPIEHVAGLLGYVDVPFLTRTLKRYFGAPPAQWRRVYRANTRCPVGPSD